MITAKTTPRAIMSLFIFSKTPKATKSRIEPNVINLPSLPSAFIDSTPAIKSKAVNNLMKRKLPNNEANIPITKPINISILLIPFPGVKLLYGVMCR